MGSYLKYQCRFCQYQVEPIPVGQGKDKTRALKLFCCERCKSIGSTWITENESPHCSFCYETEIKLLSEKRVSLIAQNAGSQPVLSVQTEAGSN